MDAVQGKYNLLTLGETVKDVGGKNSKNNLIIFQHLYFIILTLFL